MLTPQQAAGPTHWSELPLHPVVLAAFPPLFLFAENAVQQVTFDPLWLPLAASLGIGLAALLAGVLVLGDWRRGALLASLGVILFFSFGHAWNLVSGQLAGRMPLVVGYGVVALAGSLLIWRGGRWVPNASRFLNVAAALLVVFNLVRIGDFAVGAASVDQASSPPPIAVEEPDQLRDIYYIVLDRYAGAETLQHLYDYDNTPFLEALEARGFTVARDSWANYWKTAFSLLSTLSMEHLDGEALLDREPPTFAPVHTALRGHLAVPQTLTALGYEYVHIGNYWEPTAENVDADRILRYEEGSEFSAALWSTTALMLLSPLGRTDDDPETIQLDQDARGHALFGFEALEGSAQRPGPTYTFAHILVPHPPYVFEPDGSEQTREERARRTERDEYLRQLEFTNRRTLEAIDRLLDVPEGEEPIIVLAADEGPFPPRFAADQRDFDWLQATPDEILQKFAILNSLHLPGVDPAEAGIHERTSPVNTFRIIFNAYFGADLPLLPDTTYLTPDYARMYEFVEYQRP